MSPATLASLTCLLLCGFQPVPAAGYDPAWGAVPPLRTLRLQPAEGLSPEKRGAQLVQAVSALLPGDRLEVCSGAYRVDAFWDIRVSGRAEAPISIVAAEGAQVVITRSDARQNVLNLGQGGPVQHLLLKGLEITGGSHGLRLGQCSNVWIDRCHIHDTGDVCLSANSADTSRLHLTRNHLHHGGGTAEGMYLGGNNATHIMSESVIALNHVHDCRGEQGDGIEIKQGSWGNLLAENDIHDCNYPCITVYGTGGRARNVIERNVCYRSEDNVMQVQGEAIVRDNLLINGKGAGFSSTDHQGKTLGLEFIHNTVVNTGHAFRGGSWNGRAGMVLANNILYSRDASAVLFPNGHEGVTIAGNVTRGDAPKTGCTPGRGLEDFKELSWDAALRDATPAPTAPFAVAEPRFATGRKAKPELRDGKLLSGAGTLP